MAHLATAGANAKPSLAARGFFGEIGAAMAGVGKMGIPARGRAEDEFDLARVAGGNRATNHLPANRNGLATHGTHKRGTASHGPLFTIVCTQRSPVRMGALPKRARILLTDERT